MLRGRVVVVVRRGRGSLAGMGTAKSKTPQKPPIRNLATTGRPTTRSGAGIVHPGRTDLRNGNGRNGNGNSTRAASARPPSTSTPTRREWADLEPVSSMSDRDRRRLSATAHTMADHFRTLGEVLYRPDVQPDADRATGRRSSVPDERLFTGASRAGSTRSSTAKPNGANGSGKATPSKAAAKKKSAPARTNSRGK